MHIHFYVLYIVCKEWGCKYKREFKKTTNAMIKRELHQTKGLNEQNKAVHVRYKSFPSSAKQQQRKITNFCVVWRS